MGKSYGVIQWAAETENPLTVFTARQELYGQYEDWCADRDLSYRSLPAFHRECGSLGEGHSIEGELKEVYNSGISGLEIHENSERYLGADLPCQQDGECPYMESREFDPEGYDVLVGHYLQAHNQSYIEDRYVAFDEFPGDAYFLTPTHNEATRAVSNYLEAEDTLPFDNWKDLLRRRHNDEYEDAVQQWKADLGFYSHRDTRLHLQQNPDFHANAPLLTHAALEFELLDNEWEYANLGSGRIGVLSPEDEWTVLIPPSLYPAESVIALDGTPTITKWRLVLGGDWIHREEVLDSDAENENTSKMFLDSRSFKQTVGRSPTRVELTSIRTLMALS